MLKKITMPSAGQTTDCLLITRWHKKEGDPVARGDILFEVETDKAVLPVESFAKGKLLKACYAEGDTAYVGDVVAYVGEEGDLMNLDIPPAPSQAQVAQTAEEDDYAPIIAESALCAPPVVKRVLAAQATIRDLQASPAAKKAVRDAGIHLEDVAVALGIKRIKAQDIAAFQRNAATADSTGYTLIPLSAMRKTIAQRMFRSTSTTPTYTVEIEVNMQAVIALRAACKANGIKVAYHDVFAKCTAAAIAQHPLINASYTDEGLRQHCAVNVGIAVSLENGLIVPVVRDIAGKGIAQIASESAALIIKAQNGSLSSADMQGGTITISNMGMYPIRRFTAIINPPESAILAIGGLWQRPRVVNGTLADEPVAAITATFDHRIIDGAYGAAFLTTLKEYIENPALILC